jgi:hypothetical protein
MDEAFDETEAALPTKRCSVCGTVFVCGATLDRCWCQSLPALDANQIDFGLDCRCPSCLAAILDES